MIRLGYQIPNFTYPETGPDEIFDKVVAQAKAAENAGYDRVMVMDHFYQLPGIGRHDEPMFECYSMLSALAQHTETVRLSALVTAYGSSEADIPRGVVTSGPIGPRLPLVRPTRGRPVHVPRESPSRGGIYL